MSIGKVCSGCIARGVPKRHIVLVIDVAYFSLRGLLRCTVQTWWGNARRPWAVGQCNWYGNPRFLYHATGKSRNPLTSCHGMPTGTWKREGYEDNPIGNGSCRFRACNGQGTRTRNHRGWLAGRVALCLGGWRGRISGRRGGVQRNEPDGLSHTDSWRRTVASAMYRGFSDRGRSEGKIL